MGVKISWQQILCHFLCSLYFPIILNTHTYTSLLCSTDFPWYRWGTEKLKWLIHGHPGKRWCQDSNPALSPFKIWDVSGFLCHSQPCPWRGGTREAAGWGAQGAGRVSHRREAGGKKEEQCTCPAPLELLVHRARAAVKLAWRGLTCKGLDITWGWAPSAWEPRWSDRRVASGWARGGHRFRDGTRRRREVRRAKSLEAGGTDLPWEHPVCSSHSFLPFHPQLWR